MADILVAEDYPATRSALRTLLKSAGHAVRFAVNGEEALAQVAQQRPDLLLLDVMMPKKSGYEVLSEIRRTDTTLPVILLTAKGEKSDVILGLGLGSDDYVKIFCLDQLRWCAPNCPCVIGRISEIGSKSGSKAVKDMSDIVLKELGMR